MLMLEDINFANYQRKPHLIEASMMFVYQSPHLTIYPFSDNIDCLTIMAQPEREVAKNGSGDSPFSGENHSHFQRNRHTLLYRLGLIEPVDSKHFGFTPGRNPAYRLSLLGFSAHETLKQVYMWSSKTGKDKMLTRKFHENICNINLRDPTFQITKQVVAQVGFNYRYDYIGCGMNEIERIASTELFRRIDGAKAFIQRLILAKLERP